VPKLNNKLLDIREDLLQISNWNGVLLFWGVKTFNQKWCASAKSDVPRFYGRGDGNVYNRLIRAKDCRSRLLAVSLTPRLPGESSKFNFPQVVKTVGFGQYVTASNLLFNC